MVVPPRDYPRAVATIDGRNGAADLAGAPLAGVLIAWGTYIPVLFNACSFLASAIAIQMIRADLGKPSLPDARTFIERIGDGYRCVWRHAPYRLLILQGTLSNFANNAFTFALILILQQDHQQPWMIGLVQTGTAASALVGAVLAGPIVDRFKISTTILGAETLRFVSLVGVTLWHDHILRCIALTAVGFILTPAANSAERGYMAITTPDHLQGRVASFDQLVGSSLVPFAPLTAGILIATFDPTLALAAFTALIGLAVIIMLSSPATRRLPRVSSLSEGT